MARPIILSNGVMQVGINTFGMVHDLYYPYVGLENHDAAKHMRHRIGVWVEGQFSWLDDGAWTFKMDYEPRALIGHTTAHNAFLGITLEFIDCVDAESNIFMRSIHMVNGHDRPREVRLFLHQVFLISNSLNGDTAQYLPNEPAILHFKGRRAFVIGAKDQAGNPFTQYSIGLFGIEGREGTYKDAEDGSLSGNVVEFGEVDSVIGFTERLNRFESTRIEYWLVAARDQWAAIDLHRQVQGCGLQPYLERTVDHWHRWLKPAERFIGTLPKHMQAPFRKSLMIIKTHIDHKGAVIASTDTTMLNYWRDAYAYCWPRDASYALWPLLRLGYKTELKKFFAFCRDALHPEGFLMQKYRPDGAPGSTWHPYVVGGRIVPPIQEDETAIVVFLLGQYVHITKDKHALKEFYDSLVVPTCNFMADYVDNYTKLPHASYDLWEEKFLTTTYTTALVHAALLVGADMAKQLKKQDDEVHWQTVADEMREAAGKLLFNPETNYFYKGFINRGSNEGLQYDDTIDTSSFYGAFMFGLFDASSSEIKKAHKALEKAFSITQAGATPTPRYENDQYNTVDKAGMGNPWFVTSLWMAQYDLRTHKKTRATATLDWTMELMLPTGVLPEQINPYSHKFLSVAPLIWSQAEFLNTILDLHTEPESPKK